jgi:hypothetical protein
VDPFQGRLDGVELNYYSKKHSIVNSPLLVL